MDLLLQTINVPVALVVVVSFMAAMAASAHATSPEWSVNGADLAGFAF